MNTITISGYVGQVSVIRSFDTGNQVVKFSVAVKEYSPNSDQPTTMWIDVDAWNGLGERVLQCITKGREVVLTGRLAINTYPVAGGDGSVKTSKPVIKLTSFDVCGKKPQAEEDAPVQKTVSRKRKLAAASA